MWCGPGEGYSYTSQSPHVASIVLRHLVGMEMQQYIDEKLAKPMGWGQWGYALHRGENTLAHTPGGADTAIRSTDVLRFCYLILHKGKWGKQQLVPADYIELAGKPSPYQKHAPFSLMFEVNADGHVAGAPRDTFFKSGGGGYGVVVIPSLDLVIYKMAGSDQQYNPALTGITQNYKYDGSRDNWKPAARSQFSDGPIGTDDGLRRVHRNGSGGGRAVSRSAASQSAEITIVNKHWELIQLPGGSLELPVCLRWLAALVLLVARCSLKPHATPKVSISGCSSRWCARRSRPVSPSRPIRSTRSSRRSTRRRD